MIANPKKGIVEAEEMDHEFCLQIQKRYLGTVTGVYTDWYPTDGPTENRQWQFSEMLK
jgi:homospermidine synthase